MYHVFDVCPKCKDKLYEREQMEEEKYFSPVAEICCPHCGTRLIMVCCGEKEPDDTMYKVFLIDALVDDDKKEKCIEILMEIGHCDKNEALDRLNVENSCICEGSFQEVCLGLEKLDNLGCVICYEVEPEFPYTRLANTNMYFCPICEEIAVDKIEELTNDSAWVKKGTFCEHCNEWVTYSVVSKDSLDEKI